jgi:uncharacterized glyoxalase superfamily protein PhnB/predicted enzyme related to lactoylglutathione lyase
VPVAQDEQQSTSIPGLTHGQLCYLQIPALDITASARFYAEVFGWRVDPPASGFEAPGVIGQWITDRPPVPNAGPVGWIYVEDVRRTLQTAERAGASLRDGPSVDGPRLLASFTDPAGNLVGLAQHGDYAAGTPPPTPRSNRTMPPCTVIPQLVYDDVPQAIDWLCDKLGFAERWRVGNHRAQLSIREGTVAITEPRTSKALPGRQSVMVRVDDANAHCERARNRGVTIVQEPEDFSYGERQYTAEDLGGHQWTFSESIADMAPEQWGGTSGPAMRTSGPITSLAPTTQAACDPIISVMLIVSDADAAVAWYIDALRARELWNLAGVAGLEIDGAPFFLHEVNPRNPAESSPVQVGGTSTRIEVFVEDPDSFLERALAAGATAGPPITDHPVPWGTHRQGGFRDPFGHNWSVGDRSPLSRSRG